MGRKLKFSDICKTAAALNCRQSGQSNTAIAKSAGVAPGTVSRWLGKAGYRQRAGKLRHVSEQATSIVNTLLESPDGDAADNLCTVCGGSVWQHCHFNGKVLWCTGSAQKERQEQEERSTPTGDA